MAGRKKKDNQEATPPDPYEGLSDDNHNDFLADLIEDARKLQDEKKVLLGRVDKNRQACRLVKDSGHLSEKQAKFIDLTYPPRQSKDTENGDTPAPTDTPTEQVTA